MVKVMNIEESSRQVNADVKVTNEANFDRKNIIMDNGEDIKKDINWGVIYARYSSDNQRDESIDAQIRAAKEYAEKHDIKIMEIYIDRAKSATSDKRQEFQRMIADAKQKRFKTVIVHKMDRFSRDKHDSVCYKKVLKDNDIKLVSVTEKLDDSPESLILEGVIESMAQYYSANLSREVRKGMKETAIQCKHTGGVPPLGYDVDAQKNYIINLHEALIIKEIFSKYLEGYGYNYLLEYLKEKGYKTKKGKDFCKRAIYDILRNRKYTGTYFYRQTDKKNTRFSCADEYKGDIIIPDGMPRIISDEDFEEVQKLLANNKLQAGANKAKELYLLTGIIFCGHCGAAMQGNSRKCGRNKLEYKTYRCGNRANRKNCTNKELRKEYIEEYVLNNLAEVVLNKQIVPSLVKQINEKVDEQLKRDEQDLAIYTNRLDDINKQISKITNAILQGIDASVFTDKMNELQADKLELEGLINKVKSTQVGGKLRYITEPEAIKIIDKVQEAVLTRNIPECKKFIRDFVKRVDVYNDHVEVTFNMAFSLGEIIEYTYMVSKLIKEFW